MRCSGLALALLLAHGLAGAEERRASLSWVRMPGAESCISASALALAVEKRLGHPVFGTPSSATVSFEGRIEKSGPGYRATLAVIGEHAEALGTRTIETKSSTCSAIDEALVLVIAVTIDPDAEEPPTPPPEPPPPPVEPVAKTRYVTVVKHVPVVREVPTQRPWAWQLHVGGLAAVGILPGVAPGVRVGLLGERRGFVPLSADLRVLSSTGDTNGRGVTLSYATAGPAVCPLRAGTLLAWYLCVGGELGVVRAQGVGFDEDFARTRMTASVEASARMALRVTGPLFVGASATGALALLRPRVGYRRPDGTLETLHLASPFAAIFEGSVGLAFD